MNTEKLITKALMWGAGAAFAFAKPYLWEYLKSNSFYSVEADSHHDLYDSVLAWMETQPGAKKKFRRKVAPSRGRDTGRLEIGEGWYWLKFRGTPVVIKHWRDSGDKPTVISWYSDTSSVDRFIRVWFISPNGDQVSSNFIEHMNSSFNPMAKGEGTIQVYRSSDSGWWVSMASKKALNPDNLIYEKGLFESILKDIRWFQGNRPYYEARGIPYQRGYLLDGPPGNGKTSLVLALAGLLEKNLYALSYSKDLKAAGFMDLMSRCPTDKGILLLEDIDSFVRDRDVEAGLSFSELINSLDGYAAPEGRILFMTTNCKAQLDPALIRPGRVDAHYTLDNANRDQIRRMFLKFFPGYEALAKKFASRSPEGIVGMSQVQEHLILNKDDPKRASYPPKKWKQIKPTKWKPISFSAKSNSKKRKKKRKKSKGAGEDISEEMALPSPGG